MKKDKVPKWSKAAFQDKFNIMKGKLENAEDEREKKYSDMDANLAKLQRKLRDGSALETGERGKNVLLTSSFDKFQILNSLLFYPIRVCLNRLFVCILVKFGISGLTIRETLWFATLFHYKAPSKR